jgi:hypothetical protein
VNKSFGFAQDKPFQPQLNIAHGKFSELFAACNTVFLVTTFGPDQTVWRKIKDISLIYNPFAGH